MNNKTLPSISLEQSIEPGMAYVDISGRFSIAIDITSGQLELRVYPITKGEVWDYPHEIFKIDQSEINKLEKEMGDA